MTTAPHYTPTEQRMLKLLGDGLRHSKQEMHACLYDELTDASAIWMHVSRLRAKLRTEGKDVICFQVNQVSYYRIEPYQG